MYSNNRRLIFALLLIGAGVLFLLQNLGVLGALSGLVWAGLFALGGLAFLSVLITNRANWWAAIPGIILLDLALMIALDALLPQFSGRMGGAIFLAGIGLAFWVVYALSPVNWWAIIPGGVMMTLAVVAFLDQVTGIETGGVFFLGLALTFLILYLVPVRGQRMTWPWIPALVLGIMGILLLLSAGNLINVAWPVILIGVGAFLLIRSLMRRSNV